ncbi:nuclear transport factor 2 family protein [Paenarthrobacter ureafaciens]
MVLEDQFSIQRAADRLEIQHRVLQFGRSVDRKDFQALHEVFHPDAYADQGLFKGSPAEFIEFVSARHQTIDFSSHHVGNVFIEFASDDEAFVESYAFVWQSVTPSASALAGVSGDDAPFEMIGENRYVDHFTRRDDRWRIQSRLVVPGSMMRVPSEGAAMQLKDGFAQYARDERDPAEELRTRLGLRA